MVERTYTMLAYAQDNGQGGYGLGNEAHYGEGVGGTLRRLVDEQNQAVLAGGLLVLHGAIKQKEAFARYKETELYRQTRRELLQELTKVTTHQKLYQDIYLPFKGRVLEDLGYLWLTAREYPAKTVLSSGRTRKLFKRLDNKHNQPNRGREIVSPFSTSIMNKSVPDNLLVTSHNGIPKIEYAVEYTTIAPEEQEEYFKRKCEQVLEPIYRLQQDDPLTGSLFVEQPGIMFVTTSQNHLAEERARHAYPTVKFEHPFSWEGIQKFVNKQQHYQ